MSHPGHQLTLSFLPRRLVHFCHDVVEKHAKTHGYSSLVKHLWHRDTNGFIVIHKDLWTFFRNAILLGRIRRFCFVAFAVLLVLSLAVSWWVILALVPLFILVCRITDKMNSYYSLISALMLAVEFAGNDVGGCVSELAEVRSTASDRLSRYISESKTRFLDFYVPNRAAVSQSDLVQFAAAIKSDFDQGQAEHIRQLDAMFAN
jgi:hypothetical protein